MLTASKSVLPSASNAISVVKIALSGMALSEGPNAARRRADFSRWLNAGSPAWLVNNRSVKP
jgi:hypothetical protein